MVRGMFRFGVVYMCDCCNVYATRKSHDLKYWAALSDDDKHLCRKCRQLLEYILSRREELRLTDDEVTTVFNRRMTWRLDRRYLRDERFFTKKRIPAMRSANAHDHRTRIPE